MPDDDAAVGPFDDHEACVRHFDADEAVADPEGLCDWMAANESLANDYDPDDGGVLEFIESLKQPGAEKVLTNLTVTYVSGVENPAIDSQWLYAKDESGPQADWGVSSPLLLHTSKTVVTDAGVRAPVWDAPTKDDATDDAEEQSDEEQKAWAPVLIPNEADKQNDVIPASEIEDAAHRFLAEYRKIDTDHDLFDGEGTPIESWTLKQAQTFTLPDGSESREYPAGTWMLGVQFADEAWERVKAGELTGFSIYGEASSIPAEAFLSGDIPDEEVAEASAQVALAAKGLQTNPNENTMSETETEPETEGEEPEDDVVKMTEEEYKQLKEETDYLKDAVEQMEEKMNEMLQSYEDHEEEKGESGGEDPEEGPTLKEVHETVKSTHERVDDMDERVKQLEEAVFEAETDEEAEAEKAEAAVKSVLGLDDDLPEDEEERAEVVRKHVFEPAAEPTTASPDDWSDEDVSEVME